MEAGYSPNSLARNLRRNESKTIVAIVPDICDPYFTEIIRGIEEAAMENGYLVLLGDSGQQESRESSFVNLVFTKQADGMLLLGTDLPFDVSKPEQKNLPPLVMACEYAPELELPTVHIDNLTAAFEAVNYLTQVGHKQIAQITGEPDAALTQFRTQATSRRFAVGCHHQPRVYRHRRLHLRRWCPRHDQLVVATNPANRGVLSL